DDRAPARRASPGRRRLAPARPEPGVRRDGAAGRVRGDHRDLVGRHRRHARGGQCGGGPPGGPQRAPRPPHLGRRGRRGPARPLRLGARPRRRGDPGGRRRAPRHARAPLPRRPLPRRPAPDAPDPAHRADGRAPRRL
ncbi:MAG: hypothetical protein AVDCRST_MAG54-2842, partial [uncultured Actinomycetospora sp.]